jgi:hypothetical protein
VIPRIFPYSLEYLTLAETLILARQFVTEVLSCHVSGPAVKSPLSNINPQSDEDDIDTEDAIKRNLSRITNLVADSGHIN